MKVVKKCLLMFVLMLAGFASFQAAASGSKGGGGSGGEMFGAIAYDDETGDYGLTYNYGSRAAAERDAKDECGNRNCKVAVWFKNQCGAVAESKSVWGYGLGSTRKAAEKDAMEMCSKKSCEIVAWGVHRPLNAMLRRVGVGVTAALACIAIASPLSHLKTGEALFHNFGGKPGLAMLSDRFMQGLLADSRMAPHFKEVNPRRFKEKLTEQLCQLLGGGCVYTGDPMKEVHAGLVITKADFNALIEVLQDAMDAQRIAFADQNKLLALLAPMYRETVTRF